MRFVRRSIAACAVALLAGAPQAGPASPSLVKWFNERSCPALDDLYGKDPQPPYVKSGSDELIVSIPQQVLATLKPSGAVPWYVYDPKSGVAFRHIGGDSEVRETLRYAGPPPVALPTADLSGAHTVSGFKLGDPAASVVAKLGKPQLVRACGLERYLYTNARDGEPNDLDFTIDHGRIIEIYRTSWG